jgi:MFS family permease
MEWPGSGVFGRGGKAWRSLACPTRRLLLARFWRSLGQGALVVALALYLHALGWTGAGIGLVLGSAGLVGAGLNLVVGITSDRLGRKPFLLAYEMLTCLCALVAATQSSPLLLAPAIALAGFGRGRTGRRGPLRPPSRRGSRRGCHRRSGVPFTA